MVEAHAIVKRYGPRTVLNQVSVTVEPGQLTSFIGPNGAGKSTLLSIMTRLVPADAGEVRLDGRPLARYDSRELARRISVLRQFNHVPLRLTVRELVSFGRFPYSHGRLTKADEEAVDRALAAMELGDIQHKLLDQLSGGQRQRAFIAMVVAQETDYVFLDEPLNNVDMKHAVQVMKLLRRLVEEEGRSVVVVMHDVNLAAYYSDRVVALKEGCVAFDGPAQDMMEPAILKNVFGIDVAVGEIHSCRVCVYFAEAEQLAANGHVAQGAIAPRLK
ncbi:MAG: iron ABC transporter ATP-binding protein [Firmicutes bacterium ZCTH02-B6]|nr:MAG: iron ABC transporter ATP-binding protein [Firmicutes bacterium ZCTH02-B6]